MDERVWQLPGPRRMIETVAVEHARNRHVSVVLPEYLASDPVIQDSLAATVHDELAYRGANVARVHLEDDAKNLVDELAFQLLDEDSIATVPDLINHQGLRGSVAVLSTSGLSPEIETGLPAFLTRVEAESRVPASSRLSLVVVGGLRHLPKFSGGATSDLALANVWWWNRVSRWDVAAHISRYTESWDVKNFEAEIRGEIITETARWDLDLAELLAKSWDGDPGSLCDHLRGWRGGHAASAVTDPIGTATEPHQELRAAWDEAGVDMWHHELSWGTQSLLGSSSRIDRVIWAAQARVLLPWIEEQRERLHAEVLETMGYKRLAETIASFDLEHHRGDDIIEIGLLDRVVNLRIGSSRSGLRDRSKQLRRARNDLSHLRPMTSDAIRTLVRSCRQ